MFPGYLLIPFLTLETSVRVMSDGNITTYWKYEETSMKVMTEEVIPPFWTYEDQLSWPGEKCNEGGNYQSPIDIRDENVVVDYEKQIIKYGDLQFIGYQRVLMTALHNGHTIQFSCEGHHDMHPRLTGGPLKNMYRLEQVHFHWLSEHAINGSKFPMEIHLVHVRTDLSVKNALVTRDGLAIIAVFSRVTVDVARDQCNLIHKMMYYVPKLKQRGDRMSGILLDLKEFVSTSPNSYLTYVGSLTSPHCNEVVIWIIMDSPIYITDHQYRQLTRVGIGRHNSRDLQPIRLHKIYRTSNRDNLFKTPYIFTLMGETLQYFSDFFSNFTKAYRVYKQLQ